MTRKLTLLILLNLLFVGAAFAQLTAFNFQGRLNDGTTPANGQYDLQFRLFDAITGGNPLGDLQPKPNTVLVNGVFSVNLDFGSAPFNNPSSVFIEISVKPGGSPNAYTILGPRQQLTVVPFAVRAANATNADNATNAQNSVNAQNATNAVNAANSNQLNGLSSNDFIRNSVGPIAEIANQNFNIGGSGVVNGTLKVIQNTTIGTPNVTSDLNVSGKITAAGNVAQNRGSNGLVKALLYVGSGGTILRCYNGITGASTGDCGFSIYTYGNGRHEVTFGFPVNDRFVSVSANQTVDYNMGVNFWFNENINKINFYTFFSDEHSSKVGTEFMIIIF